jgi:hypothetical protein
MEKKDEDKFAAGLDLIDNEYHSSVWCVMLVKVRQKAGEERRQLPANL